MRLFRPPEYPVLALDSLEGFSEDKIAAQRFARRYWPWSLGAVAAILCFGGIIIAALCVQERNDGTVSQIYPWLAGTSFVVCIILFAIAWHRMVRGIPVSSQSGQPMEVYRLEDTIKDGKYELVYICRRSRTYFRTVYLSPGD